MKGAVSFFRSHLGQTGKATVQILPPEEKKVVSTCISLELHLRHWGGEGFADSLLKRCSTAERRMGEACMSHVTPRPKIGLFNIAHFRAVAYTAPKRVPECHPRKKLPRSRLRLSVSNSSARTAAIAAFGNGSRLGSKQRKRNWSPDTQNASAARLQMVGGMNRAVALQLV